MKRRVFFLGLQLILVGALGFWFFKNPGLVSINWLGYAYESSMAIFVSLLFVGILSFWILFSFLRAIFFFPERLRHWWRGISKRKGKQALYQALISYKAKDPAGVRASSSEIEPFLQDPFLSRWFQGQAAYLSGDAASAKEVFRELSRQPGLEFLGYEGLIQLALDHQEEDLAYALIKEALVFYPRSPWLLRLAYEEALQKKEISDALMYLDRLKNENLIDLALFSQKRSDCLLKESQRLKEAGNLRDAYRLAEKAYDLCPGIEQVLAYVPKLMAEGKKRKALRCLEEAWSFSPEARVAEMYLAIEEPANEAQYLVALQHLAQKNPAHAESLLALAQGFSKAKRWQEARETLLRLLDLNGEKTKKYKIKAYEELARLELEERYSPQEAVKWYQRISEER